LVGSLPQASPGVRFIRGFRRRGSRTGCGAGWLSCRQRVVGLCRIFRGLHSISLGGSVGNKISTVLWTVGRACKGALLSTRGGPRPPRVEFRVRWGSGCFPLEHRGFEIRIFDIENGCVSRLLDWRGGRLLWVFRGSRGFYDVDLACPSCDFDVFLVPGIILRKGLNGSCIDFHQSVP
jgi:hypothetical protein